MDYIICRRQMSSVLWLDTHRTLYRINYLFWNGRLLLTCIVLLSPTAAPFGTVKETVYRWENKICKSDESSQGAGGPGAGGVWSSWSQWGSCTTSCGQGEKVLSRSGERVPYLFSKSFTFSFERVPQLFSNSQWSALKGLSNDIWVGSKMVAIEPQGKLSGRQSFFCRFK